MKSLIRASLALLLAGGAVTAAGCGTDGNTDSALLLRDVVLDPQWSRWGDRVSPVPHRVIGYVGDDPSGPSFGRVQAVAADSGGRLAIYDRSDCRVTILSAALAVEATFGRCGSGPGEFQEIARMELRGDTIVTFDMVSALLKWTMNDGLELRRMRLPQPAGASIVSVSFEGDTAVLVSYNAIPVDETGSLVSLVGLLDLHTGATLASRLTASERAEAAGRFLNTTAYHCTPPVSSPFVVVVQQWLLQAVVLDRASLTPMANFVTRSSEAGGVTSPLAGEGAPQRPKMGGVSVMCAREWYAMSARPLDWADGRARQRPSLLEIRSYNGKVLYRGGNPTGVHPMARPRATWGNHLLFVTNEDIPQLTIVRLEPEGP